MELRGPLPRIGRTGVAKDWFADFESRYRTIDYYDTTADDLMLKGQFYTIS